MTSSDRWVSISMDYVMARPPGTTDAWTQEAAEQGRVGSQELREVAEVEPPKDVAEALGFQAGELAIVRRRVVLLDQQPIELTDSYYPTAIAQGTALAEFRKIRGGAITLLAEMGHAPHQVIEDVSARMPAQHERELLNLGDNRPVLVLFRLVIDESERPVEVSVMTTADGRHLRYELTVA